MNNAELLQGLDPNLRVELRTFKHCSRKGRLWLPRIYFGMTAFISTGTSAVGAGNFAQLRCPFVTRINTQVKAIRVRLTRRSALPAGRRTWVAKDGEYDVVESEIVSKRPITESNSVTPKETGLGENICEGIGIVSSRNTLDGRVLFGEFLSTMLFVLVSMMTGEKATIASPLPNAAMIGATAAAYMPVSGAHLNPAVTIALALTGRVQPIRAIAYIPVQIFAAITGVFISRVLGASKEMPALPVSLSKSGVVSALLLEFMPMFIITCVIFLTAVATEKEGGVGPKLAPIYIGLTVFACICAFQPAMFNPARAVAVGLFAGVLKGHWVYWIGSIMGSVAAATVRWTTLGCA